MITTGGAAIKSITFAKTGNAFIVNSADRNLRVYRWVTGVWLICLHVAPTPHRCWLRLLCASCLLRANISSRSRAHGRCFSLSCFSPPELLLNTLSSAPRSSDTFELLHKFQDLVNRVHWKTCGFSSGLEHIVGGAYLHAATGCVTPPNRLSICRSHCCS